MFLVFFLVFSKASSSGLQCPSSFECKNGAMYLSYNYTGHPGCQSFKLDCSKKFPEIQLQDSRILEIRKTFTNHSMLVYSKTFDQHLRDQNCDVVKDLALPKPLSIHRLQGQPGITLFICTKEISLPPDHCLRLEECKDHHLYYRWSTRGPEYTPPNCVVRRLPIVPGYNQTTNNTYHLFSLFSAEFLISVNIHDCKSCQAQERREQENVVSSPAERENRRPIIIGVTVGSVFILALAATAIFIRRAHKRKAFTYFSSKDKSRDLEDGSVYFGVPIFSYAELEDATHHFDASRELGDGGFGTVYYGKLRDGREVAVKRLYEHNYKRVQQFMNEVEILTRLRHKNLVSLYGCTSRRSRELLLVYEYISNGTVADHLHGERAKQSPLTWPVRMKIAVETASALVYLHASEIIHRDVKTNNILLDHNFCVKVADFGLSRLLPNDVTHVSTAPQGTPGYVDPEYHQCYQLTDKSDVYSFGVVLIELISSMPAIDICRSRDEISLANMAINRIQKSAVDELIDPFLGSDSNTERMTTLVAELAFRCLQFDSESRPAMNEVLEVLKGIQVEETTEAVYDVRESSATKPQLPPPTPENEAVGLLKGQITASPISVTAKWHSSSSDSSTATTRV